MKLVPTLPVGRSALVLIAAGSLACGAIACADVDDANPQPVSIATHQGAVTPVVAAPAPKVDPDPVKDPVDLRAIDPADLPLP